MLSHKVEGGDVREGRPENGTEYGHVGGVWPGAARMGMDECDYDTNIHHSETKEN